MSLQSHKGTVKITDSKGKSRSVLENVRFNSGDTVSTGKDCTASVALDSNKVVSMSENSTVEFKKQTNAIELNMKEGEILFDVQRKLDPKEKLDVRTGAMSIDISGAIVALEANAQAATIGSASKTESLKVLYGTAEAACTDEAGIRRTVSVPAGQKFTITDKDGDGSADEISEPAEMAYSDLNAFEKTEINNSDSVKRRVSENKNLTADDYSADGDWVFNDEIKLVAPSASKTYDGTPLTCKEGVKVYGLPEDFRIEAKVRGQITNAGSSDNMIHYYTIFNAGNEDVTSHFKNIKTVKGKLVVNPATLTVWTGSAEKEHDGKPLKNSDARLGSYIVPDPEEPEWHNLSYAAVGKQKDFEVQVLYGICGNSHVYGTNPLTGTTKDIELRAGQELTVWLTDKGGDESIKFETTSVSAEELPDEVLQLYSDNKELLVKACTDAKWKQSDVEKLIQKRINKESTDNTSRVPWNSNLTTGIQNTAVTTKAPKSPGSFSLLTTGSAKKSNQVAKKQTKYGLTVKKDNTDSLMKDYTNVHINIMSDINDYKERPLGSAESKFVSHQIDNRIKVVATGSQTDTGSGKNTYKIDWRGADEKNYKIDEQLGTLTVKEKQNASGSNGSSSGSNGSGGSSNPVGSIISYIIEYLDGPSENTTPITFETPSYSRPYDGTPLTVNEVTAIGLPDGYTFTAETSGMQTDVGECDNGISEYRIYDAAGNDVTEQFVNVYYQIGTLTVTQANATVTTVSAEKVYDGVPFSAGDIGISGLAEADRERVTVTATGTITDVGSVANTYTIDWGDVNSDNYFLSEELGTLTVTARDAVVYTGSVEKEYDAEELTCQDAWIDGLAAADDGKVTIIGNGTITDVGSIVNTYAIDWGDVNSNNYNLSDSLGTLTVTPVEIIFDLHCQDYEGFSYEYCGYPIVPEWIEGRYPDESNIIEEGYELIDDEYGYALVDTFLLRGTDKIELRVNGYSDVGTYELIPEVKFISGSPTNYIWSIVNNVMTISPAPLMVYTGSAQKVYDEYPLTNEHAGIDGLKDTDTVNVIADGMISEVGEVPNTYVIDWGDTNPNNYFITEELGTLSVQEP